MHKLESATNPPLPEAYWEATPYFKIASRQIARGFSVAPVHPNEKHGVLWNQYSHPATTLSEVIQHAKDYPNYNVAISSHRGVGKLFFWDVDSAGVVEQVEAETGQIIPATFTVQSRPESAPYKQHRYLRSTPYSFERFGGWKSKEVNVKDLNETNGEGKHPTKYDLKGIGRGGYVVSEGSRHPNGEIYTIMNDSPIIDVPDWLVDWCITDIGKYRHDAAVERERNKKILAEAPNRVPDPNDATKVMPEKVDAFLKSRCGDLAIRGTRRDDIVLILKHQLQDHTSLSKEGQKNYYHRIHDLAFDPNLKIGVGVAWSSLWEKNHEKNHTILGTTTTTVKPNGGMIMEYNSQQHLITKALRRFPDEISVEDAYLRLNNELDLGLTTKNSRQNDNLRAARKATGFVAKNRKGCWWWVRQSERQSVKSDQAASQPSADQPTVGGGNHHSRLVNQPSITHTPHTPLYTVNVVGDGNQ